MTLFEELQDNNFIIEVQISSKTVNGNRIKFYYYKDPFDNDESYVIESEGFIKAFKSFHYSCNYFDSL